MKKLCKKIEDIQNNPNLTNEYVEVYLFNIKLLEINDRLRMIEYK